MDLQIRINSFNILRLVIFRVDLHIHYYIVQAYYPKAYDNFQNFLYIKTCEKVFQSNNNGDIYTYRNI